MYSRILARTGSGSFGAASMRLIIDADRPEALWLALRIVQAVLRGTPRTWACSSSVRKPAGFDRVGQFPDFGGLARLHFRTERVRALARCLHMARVLVHEPFFLRSKHATWKAYPILCRMQLILLI